MYLGPTRHKGQFVRYRQSLLTEIYLNSQIKYGNMAAIIEKRKGQNVPNIN